MASSEYYSTLAQRCRKVATRKGKLREWTNQYLLALADRFDEAARLGDRALAGDKPQGYGAHRRGPTVR
jgi:hypothetical protein